MRSAPVATSPVTVVSAPIRREAELVEVEVEIEPTLLTNTIPKDANGKIVPTIAMWYGKVNQHFNPATGKWSTDPDGAA
jgi:hypothetical protein